MNFHCYSKSHDDSRLDLDSRAELLMHGKLLLLILLEKTMNGHALEQELAFEWK